MPPSDELLSNDPNASELLSADPAAGTAAPFDVKKQNAIMLANMAKQAGKGTESPTDAFLRGASGDTEGMTDPIAKAGGFFMRNGPMAVVKGVKGLMNTPGVGGEPMQPGERAKSGEELAGNAHDIISGGELSLAPFAPALVAAAPATALAGLVGGTVAQGVGTGAGTAMGLGPNESALLGDVSGIAGGAAGAHTPEVVGKGLIRGGAFVEKSPSTRQMLGSIAKHVGEKLTAPVPTEPTIPGYEKNMPNVAPKTPAVRVYGPSASGLGVEPPVEPVAVDHHMPNVSAEPEARAAFAPGAENVPGSQIDHNTTPPSETPASDTDRRALLDQLAKQRAENNSAFDAKAAENDPLSAGAMPEEVASKYAASKGLPEPAPHDLVKVDPARAKLIAAAYENMQHAPNDPRIKEAYDALARETADQYYYLKAHTGLQTEPWSGKGEPYASSAEMAKDVRENNHMFYRPTDAAYGSGAEASDHPMLQTLQTAPDGKPADLNYNDMFRIVHDYMAHAKGGHQFGPNGEENAFLEHSKLYSPAARAALATETRGQNSWVNFGPHMQDAEGNILKPGDPGYLTPQQRPFAQQKAGLLPPGLRGLDTNTIRVANPANPVEDLGANFALGNKDAQALASKASEEPLESRQLKGIAQMQQGTTREAVAKSVADMKAKLAKIPNGKKAAASVDVEAAPETVTTKTTTNGSGESAASAESTSRLAGMKARGERFVIKKGNTIRNVAMAAGAEDTTPAAGETFGIVDKAGNFKPLSTGTKASGKMTPEEKIIAGARGKGAAGQAERLALLRKIMEAGK